MNYTHEVLSQYNGKVIFLWDEPTKHLLNTNGRHYLHGINANTITSVGYVLRIVEEEN